MKTTPVIIKYKIKQIPKETVAYVFENSIVISVYWDKHHTLSHRYPSNDDLIWRHEDDDVCDTFPCRKLGNNPINNNDV